MKALNLMFIVALLLGATQSADAQELSRRDQLQIAVQKICPISGRALGEHGTPIKVKVGEETVFVCCKGCLQGKINPTHWATIHANFAKAQRICPVMKHELPAKAKWAIIEGRVVYVCCPPCIDKMKAAPEKFLAEVDQLYSASLNPQRTPR